MALSDGTLATLNFYPQIYQNLLASQMPLSQMFLLCNIFKVGEMITEIVQGATMRETIVLTDESPKVIIRD